MQIFLNKPVVSCGVFHGMECDGREAEKRKESERALGRGCSDSHTLGPEYLQGRNTERHVGDANVGSSQKQICEW